MSTPRVAPLRMEPYIDEWTGEQEVDGQGLPCWLGFHPDYPGDAKWFSCPYGKTGDLLWVRETHYRFGHWEPQEGVKTAKGRMKWAFVADSDEVFYEAPAEYRRGRHHKDPATPAWHKRLARFMRRVDSRITLEVTDVRVERVQNISEADARAEGFPMWCESVKHRPIGSKEEHKPYLPQEWFHGLWDSINAERGYGWSANPWVWVIGFKVVQR